MIKVDFEPIFENSKTLLEGQRLFENYLVDLMLYQNLNIVKDQAEALSTYQGDQFYEINEALGKRLTGGKELLLSYIDSTMKYSFNKTTTVFRGANDLVLEDLEVGQTLNYRQYISATLSEEKANEFRHSKRNPLLYITINDNVDFTLPDIYSMSVFGKQGIVYPGRGSLGELEVLLPREHSLKITGIQEDKVFAVFC